MRSNRLGNEYLNAASAVTRCCTAAFGVSSDTSSYTLLKIMSSYVHTEAAFRYPLSVLKLYSARYVYYRFSVLAVNIETQPESYLSKNT